MTKGGGRERGGAKDYHANQASLACTAGRDKGCRQVNQTILGQVGLDITKLDAEPTDFDLRIFTANKKDGAVGFVPLDQVLA